MKATYKDIADDDGDDDYDGHGNDYEDYDDHGNDDDRDDHGNDDDRDDHGNDDEECDKSGQGRTKMVLARG